MLIRKDSEKKQYKLGVAVWTPQNIPKHYKTYVIDTLREGIFRAAFTQGK